MFPKLRKTSAYPIFALSFADFFKSILYLANAIGNPGDKCVTNQWCACSGGLRNFFGLATFIFVAVIATMGYLSAGGKFPCLTSWDQDFVKSSRWTTVSQAVGWGVPAFTLLIIYTASNDVIGDVGGKCWITSEYRYLRWLLYYLPLLLIFIYVCTLCYLTYVFPSFSTISSETNSWNTGTNWFRILVFQMTSKRKFEIDWWCIR